MKNMIGHKRIAGIGIIEVLITTLVIALGLLAVARFQLGIVGESRDNKSMVEARSYCESGLEDFRRSMSRSSVDADGNDVYWAAASLSPYEESFTGKHATYERSITVQNLPLPDGTASDDSSVRTKQIVAECTWDGGEVRLETIMSLHDATNSALATNLGGGGGSALSPSLNAGASDDISETVPLESGDDGYQEPGKVVLIEGEYYIVERSGLSASKSQVCSDISPALSPFENGLRARRVDNDGYAGLEAIELFEVVTRESGEFCVPRVRFNGGVIIPIRGIVHSRISEKQGGEYLPVELFTLNVSESGTYCVFNPDSGATSAPYTCYVGGNCAHGPDGDDAIFTQCPSTRPANILSNVGEGGWRGRVGLLNVADAGYNVCFYEEIETDSDSSRDTARDYFSYNVGPDNALGTSDDRHQGVNKPYSCHDLLIIDGVGGTQHKNLRRACKDQAETIAGLRLASKSIRRDIATGSYANVHDPVADISNCAEIPGTQYTISGDLINQVGLPRVEVVAGGQTYNCEVAVGSYSCTFTTVATVAEVSAVQSGVRYPDPPCSVSLEPLEQGCTITFPENNDPTYHVSGFIFGSEVESQLGQGGGLQALEVDVVIDGVNETVSCSVNDYVVEPETGRPYLCVFTAPSAAVATATLAWTAASSFSVDVVNAANGDIDLSGYEGAGPHDVPGPDLSVAQVQSFTISGTITVSSNIQGSGNDLNVSVNATNPAVCAFTAGSVTWGKGVSHDYECTIPGGMETDVGITYAVDYSKSVLISGEGESTTSGELALNFGDVSSNLSNVNITISRP